jgi:isoquinoline 1-oxidoreductase beta subunit
MTARTRISRRRFVKVSAGAGAGLVIGFVLGGCAPGTAPQPDPTAEPKARFSPNAFLTIDSNNVVTVTVHRTEMGQGVRTAVAMLVAEELEADWTRIQVMQADAGSTYGDQLTGGSQSMGRVWQPLRTAGAVAREMLLAAAAQTWGVPAAECRAELGAVLHTSGERRLTFGELAELAATLEAPSRVPLKEPADFRVIGRSRARIDEPDLLTGRATFGPDVRLDGMRYAVVARPPVFGAKLVSFDPAGAKAVPGVQEVVAIPAGVAVVAASTWAALKGRAALAVTWDEGAHKDLSSDTIRAMLADRVAGADEDGDLGAATVIEALYEAPFAAHAPMEPMNCVADFRADGCEVWAPTQNPQGVQGAVASTVGGRVTVHVTQVGGGFGRRLETDYAVEAAQVSKAVGAPVQLLWPREDDIGHDYLRPTSLHRLRAGIDAAGQLVAWRHTIAAPGITGSIPGGSDALREGLSTDYRVKNTRASAVLVDLPVPTGYWRSVFNANNAFANESFIDEVAAAMGRDPVELRLELLGAKPMAAALRLAAEKAGWGTPLPEARGRGVACHSTWGVTHVAQVAEVSVGADGVVKVHRVVVGIDCGIPVNPDGVVAQMESGIAFGLTAVLKGPITIAGGRVVERGFGDYPLLRIDEMPEVEVHFVPGGTSPTGVGEMGVPPIAPAVANAVFAATGKRVRRLPIRPEDLR